MYKVNIIHILIIELCEWGCLVYNTQLEPYKIVFFLVV